MAYNQIYGIVNAATKQALGATAVAAVDATTLAEVAARSWIAQTLQYLMLLSMVLWGH